MKTFIACLFISIVSMSFQTQASYKYPDFMVTFTQKVLPGKPSWEGFNDGKFVNAGAESFLVGLDSVAVKYVYKDQYQCFRCKYTNFYSRINETQWKKYAPDGKFIKVITEHRDEQGIFDANNVLYYKVY